MYDLVEWAAAQPWCDGNVGMIGISYFAMTQLEAAVERPPHLKAIFPVAVTADLYDAASHHGLVSTSFVTPFLSMMGLTSDRSDAFWRRNPVIALARRVLNTPPLHRKFATMNGEAAVTMMRQLLKLPHNPHPWDDLWLDTVVKHPVARRVVGGAQSASAARRTSTSRSISAATGRTCRCTCRRRSPRGRRWRTTRMCGWACSASSA